MNIRITMKGILFPMFFYLSVTLSLAQTRSVGTNLNGLAYYVPQIIFKDAYKQSGTWLTRNATPGGPWDTQVTIPLRADGYPAQVPFGSPAQHVHNLVFLGAGGHYPAGTYTLLSEGTGTIQLEWDSGNRTFASPCNDTFSVTPSDQGIHLIITASDINDPVHKIRMVMPGFINDFETDPFHPSFLNFLDSGNVFTGIRFMDLMRTNASPVSDWSQRTGKDDLTQSSPNGIHYEYMTDLCNRTDKDMWICIPHQANDSFIYKFARLLHDSLEPSRKIFVEYSNEAWNSIFAQSQYCTSMGAQLNYSGPPWEQGWKYYARRTADCHRIFGSVFGPDTVRLVKVVASQAVNSWLGNQIMNYYEDPLYNPTGVTADALAIAPYIGWQIADSIGNAGGIGTVTVPQILSALHAGVNSQTAPNTAAYKTVADNHQVDLIAYEGGQHLVSFDPVFSNDTVLTDKLIAANRDPLMQDIYCDMLDAWFGNGGGAFFNYSSIVRPTKYGSWGILEHSLQPLSASPKWQAYFHCGRDSSLASSYEIEDRDELYVYPNPGTGTFTFRTDLQMPSRTLILVHDSKGRLCRIREASGQDIRLDLSDAAGGMYIVTVIGGTTLLRTRLMVE
ncbi:MAG: hypothetical protein RL213_1565 [Bacteroidota bacterium]